MATNQHRRQFIKQTFLAGMGAGVLAHVPFSGFATTASASKADKRIGIIGLDTSHSTSFTALLNDPATGDRFKGYKVVAAYPYGSRDIETSASRIPDYSKQVQAKG